LLVFTMSMAGLVSIAYADSTRFILDESPFADPSLTVYERHAIFVDQLAAHYGESIREVIENISNARVIADAIDSQFPMGRDGRPIHPDFMGDMYFNEYGHLVIQIVESYGMSRSMVYDLFLRGFEADDVVIQFVEFSHNEIMRVFNFIVDYIDIYFNRTGEWNNFGSMYVDTINNRVVVGLEVFNEEMVNLFRETVIDSPVLIFAECTIGILTFPLPSIEIEIDLIKDDLINYEDILFDYGIEVSPLASAMRPGAILLGLNSSSVGFAASCRFTGQSGFVTTGHHGFLLSSNTNYGRVARRQVTGNVDASFILRTATSQPIVVNEIPAFHTRLGEVVVPRVGDRATKIGWRTGMTSGTVDHISLNVRTPDGSLTVARVPGMSSGRGDSGGIVFLNESRAPFGNAGIVVGGDGEEFGNTTFFTPSYRIMNAFSLDQQP